MKGTRVVRPSRAMETNVPIAAAVTAYSRMNINGYKLEALDAGLAVYYSDTDSLVVNGELPPKLVDQAELGLVKLEHEISEGYFVGPKIYWLKTPEGEVTKCKGYPGDLTQEQIESLYRGEGLDLKVTRWIRSLSAQTIKTQVDVPYHIAPLFNKREKVLDSQGYWVDTHPIILGG